MTGKEMFNKFKSTEELRSYAEAQYKTIVDLSKKIQSLEDKIKQLETLLETNSPLLEEQKKNFLEDMIPNEQVIAEVQLGILKQKALSGTAGSELTLEETKKVEIYSKILANLKATETKKPGEVPVQAISNAELLKQIELVERK